MGGVGVRGGGSGGWWNGEERGEIRDDRTEREGEIRCVILKNWLRDVIELYNTPSNTTSHDIKSYIISNTTYRLKLNHVTLYRQSNDMTELGITYNITSHCDCK